MPEEYPTVIPMLSYEDGIAALEWLAKAFGFRERAHQTWQHHRETCARARQWLAVPWIIDGVLEDSPPGRRYRAEGPEGHRWFVFQRERR